jgi:hypothetical protein
MKTKHFLTIVIGLIILQSCTKEGTGGKASISGVIYEKLVDHNGKEVETRIAQDKKVFIKYGENSSSDDDTETSSEGIYEFNYLTKGDYTLYTYTDCDTCSYQNEIEEHHLSISTRNDAISQDVNTIKIVSPEDGNSSITGRIMIQKYLGTTPSGNPYIAQNTDVFIKYDSDEVHFEKTKTGHDGNFIFRDLIIGNYTLYAYSTCDTCNVLDEIKEVTTDVISNGITRDVGDLTIETP